MSGTAIAENTVNLMVSLENRKLTNKQRMMAYYGLVKPNNFSDCLKIKKMENQQRRMEHYGLQYMDWMISCKAQNETIKRKYYGLDTNKMSSAPSSDLVSNSDSSPNIAFDFEKLCKEMEEFMKKDWAMEMEKESVRQWQLEQLRKTRN